jgi:hypothetical protein
MALYRWTNHDDDLQWNNMNNWSPPGVPGDGDGVVIPDVDEQGHNLPNDGPAPPGIQLTSLDLGNLGLIGGGPVTVTESLTWHGGGLDCDLVLAGNGTVSGLDGSFFSPEVLNGHTVTVQGTLTIQGSAGAGSQSLEISTGASLFIQGTVVLAGAGFSVNAGYGTVDNDGTISVSGSCLITGVTMSHNRGAAITIPAGSTLLIGADEGGSSATLRLCGGTVSAEGSLSVGNGVGGEVDIVADTSVANLTVGPNGWVAPEFGAGQPSPTLPAILTVTQKLTWSGPLPPPGPGWYSNISGHVVIPAAATATVSNAVTLENGRIDNRGHFTLGPGAALAAGGVFNNGGILTLSDTGGTTSGAITNTGLIEKTGPGTATLDSDLGNTGNLAVRAGTLQVSDANWTIGQGVITLAGGSISQGTGSGGILLAGGTAGGILSGSGTVAAAVDNGGWVEPSGAGLTFTYEFAQHPDGNLLFPASVWTVAAGQPMLSIGGVNLTLGGSLWSLADGLAGGEVTRNLINLTAPWSGGFGRVRIKNDDTRLELTYPAAGAVGMATGQAKAAPASYGLDFRACPQPNATGKHEMQQLFENTLLSFVCFYLGPVNKTWRTYGAKTLIGQGWALLPAYFGYQQEQNPKGQPQVNVIPKDPAAAKNQGTKDGNDAVNIARGAGLDTGSIIYLDVETANKIQQQTFAYVEAWAAAVAADGSYRPGVYCSGVQPRGASAPTCDTIRQHDQGQHDLAFWVFRLPGRGETWLAQGPLDANGDVTPLAFAKPAGSTGVWNFPGYADAWQFCQGWLTAGHVIYTDTGNQLQLSTIHPDFDFDIGRTSDPGHTVGSKTKAERRRTVTSLSADASSIASGSTATLTIKIDGPAAEPDGLLVLIRSSLPEVVVPTSTRIPAGLSETSAQFSGHVPAGPITATLSARALHQLTGAPPTTQVTVTPPP